jgi:tetratricopeptide (TPR) repeat protein
LKSVVGDGLGNVYAQSLLAYTYREQDRPDLLKAIEHYKIALKFDPQHKGAHEYGWVVNELECKPWKGRIGHFNDSVQPRAVIHCGGL